jgi:hypothetical protein
MSDALYIRTESELAHQRAYEAKERARHPLVGLERLEEENARLRELVRGLTKERDELLAKVTRFEQPAKDVQALPVASGGMFEMLRDAGTRRKRR